MLGIEDPVCWARELFVAAGSAAGTPAEMLTLYDRVSRTRTYVKLQLFLS